MIPVSEYREGEVPFFLVANNEIESDQMILKVIQIFAEICHFVRLIT